MLLTTTKGDEGLAAIAESVSQCAAAGGQLLLVYLDGKRQIQVSD